MPATSRRRRPAVCLTLASLLLFVAGTSTGQDKKVVDPQHGPGDLNASLRDVINLGAVLFNDHGDHAGCYRVYQGALVAIKPFLAPDLQQKVEASLARADQLPQPADRAFELRRAIDEVRAAARGAHKGVPPVIEKAVGKQPEVKLPEKKPEVRPPDKKPEVKLPEKKPEPRQAEPKVEPKQAEPKPAAQGGGQLSGTIRLDGKPLPGGFFVTLVAKDGRKVSTLVQKEGAFEFKMPVPPGEYRVAIEPAPGDTAAKALQELPQRYRNEGTSGLTLKVQAGRQQVDLNLVR